MKIPIVNPPAQGSREEMEDLAQVIRQNKNPKVPQALQEACDKSMLSIFETYLKGQGLQYDSDFHERVHGGLGPIIISIKNQYNRDRPSATAERYGIEWTGDDLDSAQTQSYPSGHTIQAFVHGVLLGRKFPQHAEDFLSIAEMISQSRIDRGVHFPSDVDFGRQVAYLIARELLDGRS
tara:strand:- start:665 stop:1201 length:537 start_codon:yes stop_codon:yes gene_type:complete